MIKTKSQLISVEELIKLFMEDRMVVYNIICKYKPPVNNEMFIK